MKARRLPPVPTPATDRPPPSRRSATQLHPVGPPARRRSAALRPSCRALASTSIWGARRPVCRGPAAGGRARLHPPRQPARRAPAAWAGPPARRRPARARGEDRPGHRRQHPARRRAFGAPGDSLALRLDAPALAAIGFGLGGAPAPRTASVVRWRRQWRLDLFGENLALPGDDAPGGFERPCPPRFRHRRPLRLALGLSRLGSARAAPTARHRRLAGERAHRGQRNARAPSPRRRPRHTESGGVADTLRLALEGNLPAGEAPRWSAASPRSRSADVSPPVCRRRPRWNSAPIAHASAAPTSRPATRAASACSRPRGRRRRACCAATSPGWWSRPNPAPATAVRAATPIPR